jgi:hypothetical protein
VVRPTAPCWRATHALLDHLAAVGFDSAPRVVAAGPVTETLTYIDGRAGVPPLTENALTDAALVSVADLVAATTSPRRPSTRPATSGPGRSRPGSAPAWSATTTCTRPTWCSSTAGRSR